MFSKYRRLPASLPVQPCDTPSSGPERYLVQLPFREFRSLTFRSVLRSPSVAFGNELI